MARLADVDGEFAAPRADRRARERALSKAHITRKKGGQLAKPTARSMKHTRLVALLREAEARGPATEALRAQILRAVRDLGDAGVEALAASPHLVGLTALDLADNRIGDAGAQALAASPHLVGLIVLHLSYNRIGKVGAQALAASPHLKGVDIDM